MNINGKKAALIVMAALAMAVLVALVTAPAVVFAQQAGEAVASPQPDQPSAPANVSAMESKKTLKRGDEGFWSYALSTLVIRFIGVFVVLGILQLVIQVQGRIFRSYESRKKAGEAKAS